MSKVLTTNDFIAIAGTAAFKRANDIVRANSAKTGEPIVEISIYSAYQEVVDQIIEYYETDNVEKLKEIISDLRASLKTETDIKVIFRERERMAVKTSQLDNFFKAFENRLTKERLFILLGETGVGKTWITEKRYPDMVTYACNSSLDPYSLCYSLENINGVLTPRETPFLQMLKTGGKVKLDEINLLPHDSLMFIQGITDEKENVVVGSETIKISPEFKILATMNPPSETDTRASLGDALLGRAVGYTLELTDEIIMDRLGVTKRWLTLVRRLHTYLASSGMIDVRDLNYRSYQRFIKYGLESQMKFMFTSTDVANIKIFNTCAASLEYRTLIDDIEKEINNESKE